MRIAFLWTFKIFFIFRAQIYFHLWNQIRAVLTVIKKTFHSSSFILYCVIILFIQMIRILTNRIKVNIYWTSFNELRKSLMKFFFSPIILSPNWWSLPGRHFTPETYFWLFSNLISGNVNWFLKTLLISRSSESTIY